MGKNGKRTRLSQNDRKITGRLAAYNTLIKSSNEDKLLLAKYVSQGKKIPEGLLKKFQSKIYQINVMKPIIIKSLRHQKNNEDYSPFF